MPNNEPGIRENSVGGQPGGTFWWIPRPNAALNWITAGDNFQKVCHFGHWYRKYTDYLGRDS